MARIADFQICRTRNSRPRIHQIGWVQQLSAVFALIAARPLIATMRACTLNIPIRQKTTIIDRIDLPDGPLFNQPRLIEQSGKMLGQLAVLRAARATKMVEGQMKAPVN